MILTTMSNERLFQVDGIWRCRHFLIPTQCAICVEQAELRAAYYRCAAKLPQVQDIHHHVKHQTLAPKAKILKLHRPHPPLRARRHPKVGTVPLAA